MLYSTRKSYINREQQIKDEIINTSIRPSAIALKALIENRQRKKNIEVASDF